jgi:hypothetical protein
MAAKSAKKTATKGEFISIYIPFTLKFINVDTI